MKTMQEDEADFFEAGSSSEEESEDAFKIEVAETVYFEVVVTCARSSHCIRITGSVFFLFVSMLLQALLSTSLVPAIAQNQLAPKTHSGIGNANTTLWYYRNVFRMWDHEHSDTSVDLSHDKGEHSWAYWVCNGKDWSWYADIIDDYKSYAQQFEIGFLPTIANGRLFGIVAIVLWLALIVREFNSILEYALLVFMPASPVGTCFRRSADGASASLVAMPKSVKLLVVLVVIVRITINISLGYHGVMFLAYTEALKDFILNSIALGFIFDIDELVFAVFLAKSKKRHLRAIETVEVSTPRCVNQVLDLYWEIIGLVLLVVMVVLGYMFALHDFATKLREKGYCEVCHRYVKNEATCDL